VLELYQGLRGSDQLRRFELTAILIGIAIITHVSGDPDAAVSAWEVVQSTCSEIEPSLHYASVIADYSINELDLQRGRQPDIVVNNRASEGISKVGKQYHFTGLGVLWPNILTERFTAHGHDRIVNQLSMFR